VGIAEKRFSRSAVKGQGHVYKRVNPISGWR